jgi:hypothetical protein
VVIKKKKEKVEEEEKKRLMKRGKEGIERWRKCTRIHWQSGVR